MEDSTEKHLLLSQQLGLYPFDCFSCCSVYLYMVCTVLSICFVVASIARMESGRRPSLFIILYGAKVNEIVASPCALTPQV